MSSLRDLLAEMENLVESAQDAAHGKVPPQVEVAAVALLAAGQVAETLRPLVALLESTVQAAPVQKRRRGRPPREHGIPGLESTAAYKERVRANPCPFCGVAAGEPCVTSRGRTVAVEEHSSRRKLVDGLRLHVGAS